MNEDFRMEQGYKEAAYGDSLGRYTAKTFGWMFIGLLITFGVAIGMYMTDGLYCKPGTRLVLHLVYRRDWHRCIPVSTDQPDDSRYGKNHVFPVCSCKRYCIQRLFPCI